MGKPTRTIEELLNDSTISAEDKEFYKNHPDLLDGQICPVCGEYRFLTDNNYEYCPVCGWQDDLVQRTYPDFGGSNRYTLNQYKKMYNESLSN